MTTPPSVRLGEYRDMIRHILIPPDYLQTMICQTMKGTVMRNPFAALMLLVFALGLAGCATTNKITQDFKPGTDFGVYKTFSWHNYSSDINNADQIFVQRAIETELAARGFSRVNTNADLVLDLNIIKQRTSTSGGGVGLSIGLPVGSHGAIGLGTSKMLNNDNQMAGLIILDITAQQTNQIIWRGSAEAVPLSYFFLRNQAQLNSVLHDLVAQFPPK